MDSRRRTIIVALLAFEIGILWEAVDALNGGHSGWSTHRALAATASAPHLIEDGPHQVFTAWSRPRLIIDIGYADLAILARSSPKIDVSLASSSDYLFRATSPITAGQDGDAVTIKTRWRHSFATGDDRKVTVVVPPDTNVTVVSAGDVTATGLRADAVVHSVGTGSITIDDYDAPALHVASSRGDIALHGIVTARLHASSRNDGIVGTALQVRDGTVASSGPIALTFATGADTLVNAQTDDGTVSTSGFATTATASTDGTSGTQRVGAGSGHLAVHTTDGDIKLAAE